MNELEIMESEILELLQKHAHNSYAKNALAPWIAKTSIKMGHLYSDLGLKNRREMGKLMTHNFTTLAKLKPETMRWKRYLYNCIGKTAPACATCNDINNCMKCSLG
ncbi:nitrogen fixation protein NifQ [Arcobacter sp. CECT 8985]|uniref:nitrogen fixation protein NifQ n=1 Tax=Arcobacter sp. CECT 8985 TaxID=1935424 RepID=UPI00100C282B|nr:nitrogen fixation protein NifQ [Arcobacter sp. CECT 8985]RXJ87838.1 hydrogenase [Arcobacter sp. CECT 8985]